MEFISRHIMPLVIDSLGGGHTHTQTHTHTDDPHRINFKKPGAGRHAPGLTTIHIAIQYANAMPDVLCMSNDLNCGWYSVLHVDKRSIMSKVT